MLLRRKHDWQTFRGDRHRKRVEQLRYDRRHETSVAPLACRSEEILFCDERDQYLGIVRAHEALH